MTSGSKRFRAAVVVLGDLGRSPRMQYHAAALAADLAEVSLVGRLETAVRPEIAGNPYVRVIEIRGSTLEDRRPVSPALFVAHALARGIAQASRLARAVSACRPEVVLVQTPPSLPTLAVARLAASLRSARLVVDWHNFGDAMLALRFGRGHPVVRIAGAAERGLGRLGDAHLCVSNAMRDVLAGERGIGGTVVLHDRPAGHFAPIDEPLRTEIRRRLVPGSTPDALLVVSATSWSADEDLALVLDAARLLEARIRHRPGPRVVILVTGRGPLRAGFEHRVAEAALERVQVRTAWFEPEDYARVLGAADLGLSCHRSASGVDLAMKVVDFHGAGLPVLALDYGPCLAEQIHPGRDGVLFADAGGLAEVLATMAASKTTVAGLRRGVAAERGETWRDRWETVARPVIAGLLAR